MILRLASDQCAGYWDDIKNVVAASMPTFADTSQDGMNQVLANLLDGHAQAWVVLDGQTVVADVWKRGRRALSAVHRAIEQRHGSVCASRRASSRMG